MPDMETPIYDLIIDKINDYEQTIKDKQHHKQLLIEYLTEFLDIEIKNIVFNGENIIIVCPNIDEIFISKLALIADKSQENFLNKIHIQIKPTKNIVDSIQIILNTEKQ